MSIFDNTTLQQRLKENLVAGIVTRQQAQEHINKINISNEFSISFEWEVVILNVLSKAGRVIHEKEFGKKKPDVYFVSRTQPNQSFIADIVTVSDDGHQKDNPVDALTLEFQNILQRHELSIYQFKITIGSAPSPYHSHSKVKLLIPRPEELHQKLFNSSFKNFIRSIVEERNVPNSYSVKTEEIDVAFEYNPQQNGFQVSSTAYDVYPPLKQNPFLNALKGKAKQLKEAEYDGTRGIILCDGGSSMFFFRRTSALHFGSEKIIEDFLRQHSSISFVLVVFVEILYANYPIRNGYKVTTELYLNEGNLTLSEEMRDALNSLEQLFPVPIIDVRSAVANNKKRKFAEHEAEISLLSLPEDNLFNSNEGDIDSAETQPILRKWKNPIEKKKFRSYSSKLVLNVDPTEDEKKEAAQAIASGAEEIDDVGNIIAPLSLQKKALEIHPGIREKVELGEWDILYDPFTYQVIAAVRAKQT